MARGLITAAIIVASVMQVGCRQRYEEPPDETYTFVLTGLQVPPVHPSWGATVGHNLDGIVGSGEGESCSDAMDYTSLVDGSAGVDNQLAAALLPGLAPEQGDLDELTTVAIASERLVVLLEVGGISSSFYWDGRDDVLVRIDSGAVPAGNALGLDGARRLRSNQLFERVAELADGRAVVEDGRLAVELEALSIPVRVGDREIWIDLTNVRIEAMLDRDEITDGVLSGGWSLESAVDVGSALLPEGTDEETLRAVGLPDLLPNADGSECGAISLGATFQAVVARAR